MRIERRLSLYSWRLPCYWANSRCGQVEKKGTWIFLARVVYFLIESVSPEPNSWFGYPYCDALTCMFPIQRIIKFSKLSPISFIDSWLLASGRQLPAHLITLLLDFYWCLSHRKSTYHARWFARPRIKTTIFGNWCTLVTWYFLRNQSPAACPKFIENEHLHHVNQSSHLWLAVDCAIGLANALWIHACWAGDFMSTCLICYLLIEKFSDFFWGNNLGFVRRVIGEGRSDHCRDDYNFRVTLLNGETFYQMYRTDTAISGIC